MNIAADSDMEARLSETNKPKVVLCENAKMNSLIRTEKRLKKKSTKSSHAIKNTDADKQCKNLVLG